jgi:ferric-dicitrate binding protein FerR (iron transport regulator)
MRSDRRTNLSQPTAGLAVLVAWLLVGAASAQTQGCSVTTFTDPPRQVFQCRDGLRVSVEREAAVRFTDRNRDGLPEAAEVTSRGVLVESPPRRRSFQILTPHAIASVRGTLWAVDVTAAQTSVFVAQGVVEVAKAQGGESVQLRAGEGVDVQPAVPLRVTRWGEIRAKSLLGRFGR